MFAQDSHGGNVTKTYLKALRELLMNVAFTSIYFKVYFKRRLSLVSDFRELILKLLETQQVCICLDCLTLFCPRWFNSDTTLRAGRKLVWLFPRINEDLWDWLSDINRLLSFIEHVLGKLASSAFIGVIRESLRTTGRSSRRAHFG